VPLQQKIEYGLGAYVREKDKGNSMQTHTHNAHNAHNARTPTGATKEKSKIIMENECGMTFEKLSHHLIVLDMGSIRRDENVPEGNGIRNQANIRTLEYYSLVIFSELWCFVLLSSSSLVAWLFVYAVRFRSSVYAIPLYFI
jgi:hypothetical protein